MDVTFGTLDDLAALIPDIQMEPWGIGLEFNVSSYLQAVNHRYRDFYKTIIHHAHQAAGDRISKEGTKDCGRSNGFKRVFCDLHCIRDYVTKGNTAILTAVHQATGHLQGVFDQLMEYYTGGLKDMQDYMVQNQLAASAMIKTVPGVTAMFTEMKDLLQGNIGEAGKVTVLRSLDGFSNRLSELTPDKFANSSALLSEISSEASTLLSTVRLATSKKLTNADTAARETAQSLESLNKVLQAESQMIGVYRHASARKKQFQHALVSPEKALKDEFAKVETSQVLLDFDRSWWAIRSKLDAYLDAAENQASAFGDAVNAIDGYTSKCSLGLREMNEVHYRMEKVDEAAYEQLHNTWYAVIEELGMLAARMKDGDAFSILLQADAKSAADTEEHRSQICAGGMQSRKLLLKAMNDGFATQTWNQLTAVYKELIMLEDRFFAHGHEVPSDRTWHEAANMTADAFNASIFQRNDIESEVLKDLCKNEAVKPALLEVSNKEASMESALNEDLQRTRKLKETADSDVSTGMEIKVLTVFGVLLIGVLVFDKVWSFLRPKGASKQDADAGFAS